MNINVAEHFFSYFNLYIADTPELKQEVYKIRYQVYCEDLNYEPSENFPDGLEKDLYDDRSIHCLLKHRPTGIYAGCVRLVLADFQDRAAHFPLETVCSHDIDFQEQLRLDYVEISRLAVIPQFRKRKGERNSATGVVLPEQETNPIIQEKRKFPVIALSLYLSCISIVATLNLENTLTIMEARLARHLRIFGIPTELIGDFIEYHGKRGPFLLKRTEALNGLDESILFLYESIYSQLKSSIMLHPLYIKYQDQYFYSE